ncbi:hypothetical protein ACHAWF_003721 [Thalassiosira exigua]
MPSTFVADRSANKAGLLVAIAPLFGDNFPEESLPAKLMEMAPKREGMSDSKEPRKEGREALVDDVIGRREREPVSLGAMSAMGLA